MREIGEKARAWKGMAAGYEAKHMWIVKHYGNASRCENQCSNPAKRYEWANISGTYQRERGDYRELCPSCHRKLDHGMLCKRGHWLTKDNVYSPPKHPTWRNCRKCLSVRTKSYAA